METPLPFGGISAASSAMTRMSFPLTRRVHAPAMKNRAHLTLRW